MTGTSANSDTSSKIRSLLSKTGAVLPLAMARTPLHLLLLSKFDVSLSGLMSIDDIF